MLTWKHHQQQQQQQHQHALTNYCLGQHDERCCWYKANRIFHRQFTTQGCHVKTYKEDKFGHKQLQFFCGKQLLVNDNITMKFIGGHTV